MFIFETTSQTCSHNLAHTVTWNVKTIVGITDGSWKYYFRRSYISSNCSFLVLHSVFKNNCLFQLQTRRWLEPVVPQSLFQAVILRHEESPAPWCPSLEWFFQDGKLAPTWRTTRQLLLKSFLHCSQSETTERLLSVLHNFTISIRQMNTEGVHYFILATKL